MGPKLDDGQLCFLLLDDQVVCVPEESDGAFDVQVQGRGSEM